MNPVGSQQISGLLEAWAAGDRTALERMTPLVYAELRRIARRHMGHQANWNTLQPTALVNEAYLRLAGIGQVSWQNRSHFFAVCATIMRRILVDAARGRLTAKRGGAAARVDWNESLYGIPVQSGVLVSLDEALAALEKMDGRKARVVEMKFFGGMSVEEIAEALAEALGISPRSVMRDWSLARAWLIRELEQSAPAG